MGDYYGSFTVDTYNDLLDSIEFKDPGYLTKIITKKGRQSDDPRADGFGMLGVPTDARIFDMGHGPGILGRMLYNEGY